MNYKIKSLISLLARKLQEKKYSLVTAESCTGGGLAYFITSCPICSAFLERGFVTYSNEAKSELLEVQLSLIKSCGAVSVEVSEAMACGALKNSRGNIAIAITGLTGSTSDDTSSCPIGTVYITCMTEKKSSSYCEHFQGNRERINSNVIITALNRLIIFLETLE